MGKNLVRVFSKYEEIFTGSSLDLTAIRNVNNYFLLFQVTTIEEFDRECTAKTFGYSTVHEYYRLASSILFLKDISVPCLLLTALDDPIAHSETVPYYEILHNPNIVLATTAKGGHLGWYEMQWNSFVPKRWSQKPVTEFIHAIFQVDNYVHFRQKIH